MKRRSQCLILIAALLLSVGLIGCSDGPLVAVDSASDSPFDAATSSTHHGPNAPKMVPFEGRFVVSGDPDEPMITCTDPDGNPATTVPSVVRGEGQATHLGHTHMVIRIEACRINFSEGTLTTVAPVVLTGANGDALHYLSPRTVTSLDDGALRAESIRFTGGTGRFEGATGYATSQGTFDFNTLTSSVTVEGVITSVGANRR